MTAAPPRQEGWKHSFAGGVAGSVAVVALHPFDVIKTRLQVQDGFQAQQATYRGALDAAKNTYHREGWRAFYNGLTPAWLGSGVAWSAYFYAYEQTKAMYLAWTGGERLGTLWTTLSAAQAGAMVCFLTNPIWLIKTRLQLQQQSKAGPAAAAASAAAAAAAASASTTPSIERAAPLAAHRGTASVQGAGVASGAPAPRPTAQAPGAMAGPGPGSAASLSQGQVPGRPPPAPYRGMFDALVRIGKEEGWRGYYKGLGPSLVLTCHGAIQFTVYEELKHLAGTLSSTWSSQAVDGSPGQQLAGTSDLAQASLAVSSATNNEASSSSGVQGAAHQPAYRLSSLETSVCAVLSKLSASVITYPSQVVRSRLQQRFDNRELVYRGALQTVGLTWRREGLRGFYRGLGPALVRTLPQSALTLTVYEKVLQLLPGPSGQRPAV